MIGKDVKTKSAVADVKVNWMIVLDLNTQKKSRFSIYIEMFSSWNQRMGYIIAYERTMKANTKSTNYGVTFSVFYLELVNKLHKSIPYLSQSKLKKFWVVRATELAKIVRITLYYMQKTIQI